MEYLVKSADSWMVDELTCERRSNASWERPFAIASRNLRRFSLMP